MTEPQVSYVIAAWRAGDFITHALMSALSQGEKSEIIVVDDASPDATDKVVGAIADARIRYHRLDVNGGPARARNVGFKMARGRWISVLDADDYLLPGRTRALVEHAESRRLDICADNVWIETLSPGAERRLHIPERLAAGAESIGFSSYCRANMMFGSGANYGYLKPIFRRAFLEQHGLSYPEDLRIGEDFLLVAEALLLGARFERTHTAGYVYTTRSGSISHRLSPENAAAMVKADQRLLAENAARMDRTARSALTAHLRAVQSGWAFTAMVDALKSRNVAAFIEGVFRYPGALRHFAMPIRARLRRRAAAPVT